MIELNPVLAVLMIEALAVLVLFAPGYWFASRKRKAKEHRIADKLVKKIHDSVAQRSEKLKHLISEKNAASPEIQEKILQEIHTSELTFYQQMMQMFLSRDTKLFNKIDQCVDKLSEPYFKILGSFSPVGKKPSATDELTKQRNMIRHLEMESESLSQQLQIAMQSIDEISSEYTRMFNGTKSEMELQNSSKKMLGTFQDAESRVKQVLKEAVLQE